MRPAALPYQAPAHHVPFGSEYGAPGEVKPAVPGDCLRGRRAWGALTTGSEGSRGRRIARRRCAHIEVGGDRVDPVPWAQGLHGQGADPGLRQGAEGEGPACGPADHRSQAPPAGGAPDEGHLEAACRSALEEVGRAQVPGNAPRCRLLRQAAAPGRHSAVICPLLVVHGGVGGGEPEEELRQPSGQFALAREAVQRRQDPLALLQAVPHLPHGAPAPDVFGQVLGEDRAPVGAVDPFGAAADGDGAGHREALFHVGCPAVLAAEVAVVVVDAVKDLVLHPGGAGLQPPVVVVGVVRLVQKVDDVEELVGGGHLHDSRHLRRVRGETAGVVGDHDVGHGGVLGGQSEVVW